MAQGRYENIIKTPEYAQYLLQSEEDLKKERDKQQQEQNNIKREESPSKRVDKSKERHPELNERDDLSESTLNGFKEKYSSKPLKKASKSSASNLGETVEAYDWDGEDLLISERLEQGKLTKIENKEQGKVKNNIFYFYFKSSGWTVTFFTIISFIVMIFTRILTDWYSGVWGKYNLGYKEPDTYSYVYLIFVGLIVGSVLFRSIMYARLVSNASYNLFKDVIQNVLRRPMYFFDTTESGVIMNRCTKDVNDCDQ